MCPSAISHALHHRVIHDQARDIIVNRYNFTIGQLQLGGYNTHSEQRAALFQLVETVRAELNSEDAALLSVSALAMIFDSWRHSVRDDGNDAAHRASEGEMSLAVLGAGLSDAQRESLQQIYRFTHNKIPQLD
jgi:hypothetical protein